MFILVGYSLHEAERVFSIFKTAYRHRVRPEHEYHISLRSVSFISNILPYMMFRMFEIQRPVMYEYSVWNL
jgi:hypothetical protein